MCLLLTTLYGFTCQHFLANLGGSHVPSVVIALCFVEDVHRFGNQKPLILYFKLVVQHLLTVCTGVLSVL